MMTGGDGHKAEINVTPMIDVLLVLIIIFMVIAPLAPRGLEAVAPPESTVSPPDGIAREIVVTVERDGALAINRQPVESGALAGRLADLYRRHANNPIFVRGDRGLEYREVAWVIDTARGAGWERIGLMTK